MVDDPLALLTAEVAVLAQEIRGMRADVTSLKQQQEALGISLPGLARNRWKIGEGAVAASSSRSAPAAAQGRNRFKVVQGGG